MYQEWCYDKFGNKFKGAFTLETNFTAFPDYGDLYTLEEFQSYVRCGAFIPDDGTGYYATSTEMNRSTSVWDGKEPPEWATHVMWFNR